MTVERTAGGTEVSYDPATARLTVADAGGGRTLADGRLRVRLGDGGGGREADAPRDATAGPTEVTDEGDRVVVAHGGAVGTTVTLAAADGAVDVTVAVTNAGADPVALRAFVPLAGARTPFGPDDRFFEHGYQSWTPTATRPLGEGFPAEPPANRPQMCDLAAPADAAGTSHYLAALAGDAGALTLGFLDHASYLARFDVAGDGTLSAVCPADGVALAPGETRTSAPLRVDATRPVDDALAALATAVGDRMGARVPERAPTGWCSWYHYFTGVTAGDVRANLAELRAWDAPLDVVQVDDGYETAFGDWRTLAEGFEDMAGLCSDVAAAGYAPGLWLAPFYVQADSALAAEHPSWLVTDGEGDPVDAGPRHGPMYGLDTTHPGARDWLADTVGTVVGEWGFEYLKLDFLYAAALPGERHADVTRAEAYRRGLRTVREAAGDDAFLLGCGAPPFPSVGLVDAMRVGPDTAPRWHSESGRASEPAHGNAVRNVLNRQFCHRRLWGADPDCQLLRGTTELTAPERRAFAALVALTGGSNFLSDAVAELDADGRALFERTLPPVEGGRVEGLGRREFPDRVVCERPADGAAAVAAFNWGDDPATVRVDPADHVAGGRARRLDVFAEQAGEGPVERDLPAHGVLLVHPAPARERPHLVGARHLANAAGRLSDVAWADGGATGTLSVTLDAARPLAATVATPGEWAVAGADGTGGDGSPAWITLEPGRNEVAFRREGSR